MAGTPPAIASMYATPKASSVLGITNSVADARGRERLRVRERAAQFHVALEPERRGSSPAAALAAGPSPAIT